jgi:trk system potassium uptake protein TrkA
VAALEMKVIIVGLGHVGMELATELVQRGTHDVVLVDIDREICESAVAKLDVLVITGDGTVPEVLVDADVEHADALVAVTGSDALNTVVAMLGRHFDVATIIVKLHGLGLRAACQRIGVTHIVAPALSAAGQILATLSGFDRLDFSVVARGGIRLVEAEVRNPEVDGVSLKELAVPDGMLIVAILRGQRVLLPRGPSELARGDVLLTLVERKEAYDELLALLGDTA